MTSRFTVSLSDLEERVVRAVQSVPRPVKGRRVAEFLGEDLAAVESALRRLHRVGLLDFGIKRGWTTIRGLEIG